MLSGSWDKSVKQWEVEAGVPLRQLSCLKAVTAVASSPSLSLALSASSDGNIGLWDLRADSADQKRFRSHTGLNRPIVDCLLM